MIYILFGCFLSFFIFDSIHVRKVDRHDGVLFPLCQLRRDIMQFLYENVFEKSGALSRQEYQSVMRLLKVLNNTISNYNEHKTVMFNLREMAKHLKSYQRAATPTVEVPAHPEIREMYQRFGRLLVKAFIAYTPLIRWELAVRLVVSAYRAGKKTDARRAYAEYVLNNAEKVREDARRYGLLDGAATV